jgi:hypothetical protein
LPSFAGAYDAITDNVVELNVEVPKRLIAAILYEYVAPAVTEV